jgi:hypothetical protein
MVRPSLDSPDAFIRDVIEESGNASGTWSLATHNRLACFLGESAPEAIDAFTLEVTKRLIAPECAPVQRFKLAQLCTTVRRTCPRVSALFETFKSEFTQVAALNGDPIDPATAKLVNALVAPPAHVRSLKHSSTPVCRLMPKRWRPCSMTPQPH